MATEDVNSQTSLVSSGETGQPVTSTVSQESNNKDLNATKPQNSSSQSNNVQRIQERKQQIFNWPQVKKLLKLSAYSACQAEECKCNGWKNPQMFNKSQNSGQLPQPPVTFYDPCHGCTHSLENHVKHLSSLSEEEINRLLGMVIDSENIYITVQREEDPDTRRVYVHLYKLLRRSIIYRTKPVIEGSLKKPPFEDFSIVQAVTNFVLYKFSHLPPKDWQMICDMAKMFLHCMNYWSFETPSAKRMMNEKEAVAYRTNFTRWLVYCHIPQFCDSLQHYNTTVAFGKELLQAVFKQVSKQLVDKIYTDREKIQPDKRVMCLTHLPKYVFYFSSFFLCFTT